MPIFFQQQIDEHTKVAVWKIEEDEAYFLEFVPLQRSIKHPHKRLQHLAGRFLLTHLFPQFPINLIQLADTRKPFLPDEAYHFSISHCGDYAAAIVSTQNRVGVDIEAATEKITRIAHKFLHATESALLHNEPSGEKVDVMRSLIWSGKEAMFKWWGHGGIDFSEMLIVSPGSPATSGSFPGLFVKEEHRREMDIHYRQFGTLFLAWVCTGGEGVS